MTRWLFSGGRCWKRPMSKAEYVQWNFAYECLNERLWMNIESTDIIIFTPVENITSNTYDNNGEQSK